MFLCEARSEFCVPSGCRTLLKLFMLEADICLHKMLTPGGRLHADAGLSQICEKDRTLFAD